MTETLTFGPPAAVARRATLVPLAAREVRRFTLNPVFLFAVAFIVLRYGPARTPGPPRLTPPTRTRRSSSAGSA